MHAARAFPSDSGCCILKKFRISDFGLRIDPKPGWGVLVRNPQSAIRDWKVFAEFGRRIRLEQQCLTSYGVFESQLKCMQPEPSHRILAAAVSPVADNRVPHFG